MEEKVKKECMCITQSLCCTPENNNIVNQLYFNKKFLKIKWQKNLLYTYKLCKRVDLTSSVLIR